MNVHTILILLIMGAMGPATASAGTMAFSDLDFGDNVLKIYYINGSGTILNETIFSNGTANINSPNDYVVVMQPENIDVMKNPTSLNPYLRAIMGVIIVIAALAAMAALFLRVIRRGSS